MMNTVLFSCWPQRVARLAAVTVFLLGTTVLIGWAFDLQLLKTAFSGGARMASPTALCFVIAAVALWCAADDTGTPRANQLRRRITVIGGGVITLLALLRLGEILIGWNFGLERFPYNDPGAPARMAEATALDFLLIGLALLLVRSRRLPIFFQVLVLTGAAVAWLGISRMFFGAESLTLLRPMALHSGSAFLLLNAGVLCLRTDTGLTALFLANDAGGQRVRRLLFPMLLLLLLMNWGEFTTERAGWFTSGATMAIFTLMNMILFGALLSFDAASLSRAEAKRREAQARSQTQLERLNLLHQITRAIGEHQDLRSIYQVVIRSLEDNLPIDFACLCIYDEPAHTLTVTSVGAKSESVALELALSERAVIPIDENGLSRCVRGELVHEPDIAGARFPFPQRLERGGLRSLVITPLAVESRVFGVLVAARREARTFSSSDCEFLKQLCEHVALASHQSQLHGALQQAYDDLRQTQQAVMQQERLRALGEMASGIAHDINNALSPVTLYTEALLEKESGLSDKGREYLKTIGQATDDIAETVTRMREFYRQREPQLTLESVALNPLLKQVIDLTEARWHDLPLQRGVVIQLATDLAPDLPSIMGVASEIREALVNLVFNAVDAMPQGGTLTLRTRVVEIAPQSPQALTSRHVRVEVADTGVGMDEDTRRRCLEPFFTTKGERGTGLGLAMVYGAIKRHGADLEIESAVGQGTTMRLTFPVPTGAVTDSVRASPVHALPPRLRLLVIDDDPLLIKSLRDILESDGHLVVAANGGQAGIELFAKANKSREPFAAVLTDLGMPHVDGRKVAASIKSLSPGTPVILLTGWGNRLVAEEGVPLHIDRVLNKPPKVHELRTALAEVTGAPGSRPAS